VYRDLVIQQIKDVGRSLDWMDNFAPHIKAPVLLLAGRDDFRRPLKQSQEPLMRLLGSKEKRHYVFEGGHVPPRWQEVIKETLDWFDRYLGPV
jgi:dipeptidyl aminopeptidase/acylaminoacyl peptidase